MTTRTVRKNKKSKIVSKASPSRAGFLFSVFHLPNLPRLSHENLSVISLIGAEAVSNHSRRHAVDQLVRRQTMLKLRCVDGQLELRDLDENTLFDIVEGGFQDGAQPDRDGTPG